MDRLKAFEGMVGPLALIIALDCSDDTMVKRLCSRGRFDDDVDGVQKRIHTFKATTMPVIDALEEEGRVKHVDADTDIDHIRQKLDAIVAPIIERCRRPDILPSTS